MLCFQLIIIALFISSTTALRLIMQTAPNKKTFVPGSAKKTSSISVTGAKKASVSPAKKSSTVPVPVSNSNQRLPAIFLSGFDGSYKAQPGAYTASSFARGLVGADVEAGEFDPFQLSVGVSEETMNWYRAAELKVNIKYDFFSC